MKKLGLIIASVVAFTTAASAELSRYELRVRNDASVGIRNIQVRDLETDTYLGDKLVGRIPPNTAATIDLSNKYDSCRLKLVAVLYDERKATKIMNVCSAHSWTIVDPSYSGDEFD